MENLTEKEADIIRALTDPDDKRAYERTKQIAAASASSPEYYPYLRTFASLLGNKKSYIRTRAFLLCCSQARWDGGAQLKTLLPAMLVLLHDEKPTVVRQCLNAIKEVAVFCPELNAPIRREVLSVDASRYKDSMRPLIKKDIRDVLTLLDEE